MPRNLQPIRFRLYPEKQTLFFIVHVWLTQKAMHRRLKKLGIPHSEHTQGTCSAWRRYKNGAAVPDRRTRDIGELNFHRGLLNAEIVSHEIAHAMVQWARRMRVDPLTDAGDDDESSDNERFCYATGRMMAQFAHQAYRRRLWS